MIDSRVAALDVSLSEVIDNLVDKRLRSLGKVLPGTVVSYDSGTETATVAPGIHRLVPAYDDPDVDLVEELPAIPGVPVCWLRARGLSAVGDLQAGDPVLLLCCDRDLSGWLRTGQPSEPDDARMHTWGSAVCLPVSISSARKPPPPPNAAALASKVSSELNALRTAFNTFVTTYGTHVHSAAGAGPPTVAGVPALPIGSVTSDTLKVSS